MSDTITLPDGYVLYLDKIPTVRDIIAIKAQVGWYPTDPDEIALKAWADSMTEAEQL
jgi:hypothetical protein